MADEPEQAAAAPPLHSEAPAPNRQGMVIVRCVPAPSSLGLWLVGLDGPVGEVCSAAGKRPWSSMLHLICSLKYSQLAAQAPGRYSPGLLLCPHHRQSRTPPPLWECSENALRKMLEDVVEDKLEAKLEAKLQPVTTQLTALGKQLTAVERATAAAAESSARTATALRKLDGYWPCLTMFDGERPINSKTVPKRRQPMNALPCAFMHLAAHHACMQSAGCTCQRVSVLRRHVGCLRAPCFGPCPEWISWCCCRLCCAAHAAPLLLPVQRATWWDGWSLKATPLIWTLCWTRWLRGIAATSSCSNCCCTDWR